MGGRRLAARPLVGVIAAAALAALAFAAAAQPAGREPSALRGVLLAGDTRLRLLVADSPPFVLDVDSGRVTRLRGVPRSRRGVLSIAAAGGRGAVVHDERGPGCGWPRGCFYGVVAGGARAIDLGRARYASPGADGRSAWLVDSARGAGCSVRRVGLDGRTIVASRRFPCGTRLDPPGGGLGLVVRRTTIVDPRSGRTVLRVPWSIVAVAGERLLLYGPGHQFTLLGARDGKERRLAWPSILDFGGAGLTAPRGRFVVLEFGDPAWRGSGAQALDLWVLDTRTGAMTEVPSMPAFVSLKRTSQAWTRDGRLVVLGEDDRGAFVAVWRPGERQLALKRVGLPERTSGSDSFAVLG